MRDTAILLAFAAAAWTATLLPERGLAAPDGWLVHLSEVAVAVFAGLFVVAGVRRARATHYWVVGLAIGAAMLGYQMGLADRADAAAEAEAGAAAPQHERG